MSIVAAVPTDYTAPGTEDFWQPLFGTDRITLTLRGRDNGRLVDFEGTALQLPGVAFKATLTRISD